MNTLYNLIRYWANLPHVNIMASSNVVKPISSLNNMLNTTPGSAHICCTQNIEVLAPCPSARPGHYWWSMTMQSYCCLQVLFDKNPPHTTSHCVLNPRSRMSYFTEVPMHRKRCNVPNLNTIGCTILRIPPQWLMLDQHQTRLRSKSTTHLFILVHHLLGF